MSLYPNSNILVAFVGEGTTIPHHGPIVFVGRICFRLSSTMGEIRKDFEDIRGQLLLKPPSITRRLRNLV